jgi:hypothetical protein
MTRSNFSGQTPTESTTAPLNNPPLNIAAPFVAGAFIIMLNDLLPANALTSVTVAVKPDEPAALGVPEIKHPELILRPVGRLPDEIEPVSGVVTPEVLNACQPQTFWPAGASV